MNDRPIRALTGVIPTTTGTPMAGTTMKGTGTTRTTNTAMRTGMNMATVTTSDNIPVA
jgi:hypothetical protein